MSMKNRFLQARQFLAVCCALLLTAIASHAQKRFPALEVIPYPEQNITTVVAREVSIPGGISYSCGYFFPGQIFSTPKFYSFSIYGYHDKPQWKDVKVVNFIFAGKTFSKKPLYQAQGPDRDRSLDGDGQDAEYFESMIVELPPTIARQIAYNGGVVVTTDPTTFFSAIPASKLDRFKQVVDSVKEFIDPAT
jgi:hypothetical protein